MKKLLIVSTLGIFLSGCLTTGMSPQQGAGTLVGAAAGGLIGTKFGKGRGRLASTAVGTAVGAMAGNLITQPHEHYYQYDQGYYSYPEPEYYQPQRRYHRQSHPRRHCRQTHRPQKPVVHHHYYHDDYPVDNYWY